MAALTAGPGGSTRNDCALSVCIPTYNFGRFIGETLDSVVGQLTDTVEVVIIDGASTDDTADVVERFRHGFPQIRYYRLDANGGIDRDMAAAVALAKGAYCWLFSSDDTMKPGAVAEVLRAIESRSDLYLCTHTVCTLDMTYLRDYPVLALSAPTTFHLAKPQDRDRYFGLAQNTEAFFSFMGGLIVRKSRWDEVPLNEAFVGTCWAHAARLCELAQSAQGLSVTYLPQPLLNRRGDNDSFAGRGIVRRHALAIEGYHRIADTFFGSDTSEAWHIRRAVRNEYGLRLFLDARLRCHENPTVENRALLDDLVRKAYRDAPATQLAVRLACRLVPMSIYSRLRKAYRRMRFGAGQSPAHV